MLCVLMKILACTGLIKKTRKTSGFEILHVWVSFSNDFIAVKGLSRLKQLSRLKVGSFERAGFSATVAEEIEIKLTLKRFRFNVFC